MKRIYKLIQVILCISALLFADCLSALAKTSLESGAVKGLPSGLTVVDEQGNAADSATGEYFFEVEGMQFGETYTKKIQLMNLRDDESYHIYFYVEPISQTGEINLQDWCSYAIYLDNSKIYEGGETGNDAIDLTQTHLDLGLYKPGSSRTMQVDVVWDQGEYGDLVNGGKRLVDIDGEHILEEPSGVDYVEGETTFRWIFYAVVEPQSTPSSSSSHSHSSRRTDEDTASGSTFGFLLPQIDDVTNGIWGFLLPQTGVQSEESMWYLLMFAAAALCAVTAVLVLRKKRK